MKEERKGKRVSTRGRELAECTLIRRVGAQFSECSVVSVFSLAVHSLRLRY